MADHQTRYAKVAGQISSMQSRGQRLEKGSLTTNSIRGSPRAIRDRWMGRRRLRGRGWRPAPEAPNSSGTSQRRGPPARMVTGMSQTCGAGRGGPWQGPAMAGGLQGRSPSTADGILRRESRRRPALKKTRGERGGMERRDSSGPITWGRRQCPLKTLGAAARSSHPPLAAAADPPSRPGRPAAASPSDPPWGRARPALGPASIWSPGGALQRSGGVLQRSGGAPGPSGAAPGRGSSGQRWRAAPGPGRTSPRWHRPAYAASLEAVWH